MAAANNKHTETTVRWYQRTDVLAASGCLLMWASLPPGNWVWLAWIAVCPWLLLIRQPKLTGWRPYVMLWIIGGAYWIAVLQGVRLAHWANYFGLLGLGFYYGSFLPLFVGISRLGVHRFRWPLALVAPICWVAIELLRGHGPVGFSGAILAHTQVFYPVLIQIADLGGAYLLSALIILVSVALLQLVVERGWRRWVPLSIAAVLLAATFGYGKFRLEQPIQGTSQPLRIALIQGSIDTTFGDDPDRAERILQEYAGQSYKALKEFGELDLIVWPESMFPLQDALIESDSPEIYPDADLEDIRDAVDNTHRMIANLTRGLSQAQKSITRNPRDLHLVLGTTVWRFSDDPPQRFNSALWILPDGEVSQRYFKMHPVLFGEYVPFGEYFPWIYRLTPMVNGLSRGRQPEILELQGVRLSPSICFESTVPHLMRWQVAALRAQDQDPDILLNITNDGWFWGSSILDLHFNCGVFRAVENRKPFVVAANTGFSAWVDGNGQVIKKGARRRPDLLLAQPQPDGRISWYQRTGDLFAWACVLICLGWLLIGWWRRPRPDSAAGSA